MGGREYACCCAPCPSSLRLYMPARGAYDVHASHRLGLAEHSGVSPTLTAHDVGRVAYTHALDRALSLSLSPSLLRAVAVGILNPRAALSYPPAVRGTTQGD